MKKPFTMNYKTYDDSLGRGSPKSWRASFRERMSKEEATKCIADDSPESILEMSSPEWSFYTFEALQQQFRKLILIHHPDKGGDTIKAQKIIAAYTILKERFGK